MEPTLAEHGVCIEDIRWILLTHGHVDHLGGAYNVWEKKDDKQKWSFLKRKLNFCEIEMNKL
ncbi:MBL fold metallo-hydrolase [Lysinibacillus antri]|uniref:MBL fold metallo-hydrolase n=1 Tax=Lysinibacillus antri TaxID=2498145 RepID=A0A3S0QN70_9BACI|nr:MBL fold metallo-hydrolase [Lysinibacillus antri]